MLQAWPLIVKAASKLEMRKETVASLRQVNTRELAQASSLFPSPALRPLRIRLPLFLGAPPPGPPFNFHSATLIPRGARSLARFPPPGARHDDARPRGHPHAPGPAGAPPLLLPTFPRPPDSPARAISPPQLPYRPVPISELLQSILRSLLRSSPLACLARRPPTCGTPSRPRRGHRRPTRGAGGAACWGLWPSSRPRGTCRQTSRRRTSTRPASWRPSGERQTDGEKPQRGNEAGGRDRAPRSGGAGAPLESRSCVDWFAIEWSRTCLRLASSTQLPVHPPRRPLLFLPPASTRSTSLDSVQMFALNNSVGGRLFSSWTGLKSFMEADRLGLLRYAPGAGGGRGGDRGSPAAIGNEAAANTDAVAAAAPAQAAAAVAAPGSSSRSRGAAKRGRG